MGVDWGLLGKRGETCINPNFVSRKRTYYILHGHFQGNGHFVASFETVSLLGL